MRDSSRANLVNREVSHTELFAQALRDASAGPGNDRDREVRTAVQFRLIVQTAETGNLVIAIDGRARARDPLKSLEWHPRATSVGSMYL